MKTNFFPAGAFALAASAITPTADAFVFLYGYKAPVNNNELMFYLDIPGASPSGASWNDAFMAAAGEWSAVTGVQIKTTRQATDPCDTKDFKGGVGFSETLCGYNSVPSAGVSAFASARSEQREFVHADIYYNSFYTWDVYDGRIRGELTYVPTLNQAMYLPVLDFKRTSLHEIGHALGIGHSTFPRSLVSNDNTQGAQAAGYYKERLTLDDICGVAVVNDRPQLCPILLPHPVTASGKMTTATFVGGASKDRGVTFDQVFQGSDTIDIMGTVVVEDGHFGRSGRLHAIIELTDGTALMKTADGFAPWDGSVSALRSNWLVNLKGANEIHVLENFNLGDNGVRNIGVAVYFGYSLDSEPNEVYYTGTPIQFRVE